jgi:hypothetical protein
VVWAAAVGCTPAVERGGGGGDTFSVTRALTAPIQFDFEDGTLQGWVPRGGAGVVLRTAPSRRPAAAAA